MGFKASHLAQTGQTHHKRRAGTDHRPQPLTIRLNPAIEAFFIGQQPAFQAQVAHHRIGIHVGLGCLHKADKRIPEQTDRAFQKTSRRHHIGIKNSEQLRLKLGQGRVEIAGLGMDSLGAGLIPAPQLGAQPLELRPGPVIEQPNLNIGIVEI